MEQFEQVIEQLIGLFEEHLPLEEEKRKAASESNLAALEDCMTREQAIMLKLRGLEQKRENVLKQNGWEGKTFREIIDIAPAEKKAVYSDLYERMNTAVNMFREANESAMETVRIHLREINNAIDTKQGNTYGQDGTSANAEQPMTSRRV